MLDYVIKAGNLIDWENKIIAQADIGIRNGKIEKIGSCIGDARAEIDAEGKMVSPGLIDIHMHEEDLELTQKTDYDISHALMRNGVTTVVGGNCGSNRNTIEEFREFVEQVGYPVNYMTYIAHNSLRNIVGNADIYAKSSPVQIQKMKDLIQKYVEKDCIGLSYGLEYCPGIDLEEAIRVGEVIRQRNDLLIAFHARYDSVRALESIEEISSISKLLRVPTQISHLSSLCAYGNMDACLDKIEALREAGLDIMADAYPYHAFSCKIGSAVFDKGCFENWGKSYDSVMLAEGPEKGTFCDQALFEKMRRERPLSYVVAFMMNENEIIAALKKPYVFVGSDGGFNNHQGHPRGAGAFTKVLGNYHFRNKELDLFETIRKMSGDPAGRLRLAHRKGSLKEGFDADLFIFDPQTVMDGATFTEPQRPPVGISYVFVNGGLAVKDNQIVSSRLGQYIHTNAC